MRQNKNTQSSLKKSFWTEERLVFMEPQTDEIRVVDAQIPDAEEPQIADFAEPDEEEIQRMVTIKMEEKSWPREAAEESVRAEISIIRLSREKYRATLLAQTDGLTGLNNKRQLEILLEQELARVNRYEKTLSFVMIDMDHFKAINDSLGHPVGDSALRILAELIKSAIRDEDIAARFGGEEFAVILAETEEAATVAERLRAHVEREFKKLLLEVIEAKHHNVFQRIKNKQHPEHVDFDKAVEGTVSIGLATVKGDTAHPLSSGDIVRMADSALYEAKKSGRNQVAFTEDGETITILNQETYKTSLLQKLTDLREKLESEENDLRLKTEMMEGLSADRFIAHRELLYREMRKIRDEIVELEGDILSTKGKLERLERQSRNETKEKGNAFIS